MGWWSRCRGPATMLVIPRLRRLVAWLAVACSKSAVRQLMRIAWATVGSILTRVQAESTRRWTGWPGCGGSGSRGQLQGWPKYLTVVVDHDTGRLVWAAPGANKATLQGFFACWANGVRCSPRCRRIRPWIAAVVAACAPAAVRCADPFHVVKWATNALDLTPAAGLERLARAEDKWDRPGAPQGDRPGQSGRSSSRPVRHCGATPRI